LVKFLIEASELNKVGGKMGNDDNLIKLQAKREEKQETIRREYERYLFNKILGCYTVVQKLGMRSMELADISKSGISFRMSSSESLFAPDEELDIRFYFSNKSYLDCKVKVIRTQKMQGFTGAEYQYGCEFDKSTQSYEAVEKFVDFIECFSKNAKEDRGDKPILYF
jgi:hypothetical protein